MAYLTCKIDSLVIGQLATFITVLPEYETKPLKTLYLLHGLMQDCTSWGRFSRIESFAAERGIAVVMPDGARSFYEDMAFGRKYYTHVAKEIVNTSRKMFNLSQKREDTFIAGLSMGGYGALKIALRNPDVFGAAASISGPLDAVDSVVKYNIGRDAELICGSDYISRIKGSDSDLMFLLEQAKGGNIPRIFQSCGTEDFLYLQNRTFRTKAAELGIDTTYEEYPGEHNWDYWNGRISAALDFFLNT